MKKQIFDEKQMYDQRKYGMNAFFILFFSVIINAVIRYYKGDYATPVNESMLIIFFPFVYFLVLTISKASYTSFSNNKKLNTFILIDLIGTFVFIFGFFLYKNGFSDVLKNGLYSDFLSFLIICVILLVSIIAHLIRFIKDKKEEIYN